MLTRITSWFSSRVSQVFFFLISVLAIPLNEYERLKIIALYRHLNAPSASELVELLKCEGIATTR